MTQATHSPRTNDAALDRHSRALRSDKRWSARALNAEREAVLKLTPQQLAAVRWKEGESVYAGERIELGQTPRDPVWEAYLENVDQIGYLKAAIAQGREGLGTVLTVIVAAGFQLRDILTS